MHYALASSPSRQVGAALTLRSGAHPVMKANGEATTLSDERLVSATSQINQITEDIKEAGAVSDASAVAGDEGPRLAPKIDCSAEFEMTITLQSNTAGVGVTDPVFVKRVFAKDEVAALMETTQLVRSEQPELNSQRLLAWSFRRIESAEAPTDCGPSAPAKLTIVAK